MAGPINLNLHPRAVIRRDGVSKVDLAIERTDIQSGLSRLAAVYILDGTAYLAFSTKFSEPPMVFEWENHVEIGPAVDVAIDYHANWQRHYSVEGVQMSTSGEPYIFIVNSAGALTVRQGALGLPHELVSSGVTAVSACRGWISNIIEQDDQGIVAAYIAGGHVYYRNYCRQADSSFMWEPEVQVVEFDTTVNPASSINAFRGNDYRIGLAVEINGKIYLTISLRMWPGLAIPTENISVGFTDMEIDINTVTVYDPAYLPDENISLDLSDMECMLCEEVYALPVLASNPPLDPERIDVEFDQELYGTLVGEEGSFTVRDSIASEFTVLSTEQGASAFIIRLNMSNFSAAIGDMTVFYSAGGLYHQRPEGCMMQVASFNITFTPDLMPPEGYEREYISIDLNSVVIVENALTYLQGYQPAGHNVSATFNDMTIVMYHVSVAPP